MVYFCTPSDGTKKLWITSWPVVSTRTLAPTGMTSGSSTARLRSWPGFRSSVGIGRLSKVKLPLVRVGVVPVPLPALHVDRQVRVARPVLVVDQAEGRDGDHHQDQHRHHRPGDLEHGVVAGARRRRVGDFAEAPHAHSASSAITKIVMTMMIHSTRVLKSWIASFTGPAAGLQPNAPGHRRAERGCASRPRRRRSPVVLRPRHRRPEEGRHRQAGRRAPAPMPFRTTARSRSLTPCLPRARAHGAAARSCLAGRSGPAARPDHSRAAQC